MKLSQNLADRVNRTLQIHTLTVPEQMTQIDQQTQVLGMMREQVASGTDSRVSCSVDR